MTLFHSPGNDAPLRYCAACQQPFTGLDVCPTCQSPVLASSGGAAPREGEMARVLDVAKTLRVAALRCGSQFVTLAETLESVAASRPPDPAVPGQKHQDLIEPRADKKAPTVSVLMPHVVRLRKAEEGTEHNLTYSYGWNQALDAVVTLFAKVEQNPTHYFEAGGEAASLRKEPDGFENGDAVLREAGDRADSPRTASPEGKGPSHQSDPSHGALGEIGEAASLRDVIQRAHDDLVMAEELYSQPGTDALAWIGTAKDRLFEVLNAAPAVREPGGTA